MPIDDAARDSHWIDARRPLWLAFSELWLDTELDEKDLERIAAVLAQSGLSLADLREIYLVEVAPAVHRNLLSSAGAWSGFEEAWLVERITSNLRDRPRRTRFLVWFPLTRRMMTYATERHWRRLVEIVGRIRQLAT